MATRPQHLNPPRKATILLMTSLEEASLQFKYQYARNDLRLQKIFEFADKLSIY